MSDINFGTIDLLAGHQKEKVASEEKPAAIMTRNELIDNASKILKEAGIDTIQQLAKELKSNQKIKNDAQREVFIEFLRQELASRAGERLIPSSYTEMGEYLAAKYANLDHEEFHLISANSSVEIIADDCLAVGRINIVNIEIQQIMRQLIVKKAAAFFIMHNHPSGKIEPSKDDDKTTRKIKRAAKLFNFAFIDHVVIGDGKYYSYRLNENIIK